MEGMEGPRSPSLTLSHTHPPFLPSFAPPYPRTSLTSSVPCPHTRHTRSSVRVAYPSCILGCTTIRAVVYRRDGAPASSELVRVGPLVSAPFRVDGRITTLAIYN